MNRTTRRAGSLLATPAIVAAMALAWPSPSAVAEPGHDTCARLAPSRLPHTADAAEAWLRTCVRDRGRVVPSSADGATGWLDH